MKTYWYLCLKDKLDFTEHNKTSGIKMIYGTFSLFDLLLILSHLTSS